jgi:hypothetical protein
MVDDRYLDAIPRDDLRAHLGPMPTEPITVPTPEAIEATRRKAQAIVAEEWLADQIRRDLLEHVGHGPRHRGHYLPLNTVAPWADEEDDQTTFTVRMGEHTFQVAVRRL